LLFQDLMVVPMLVIIGGLALRGEGTVTALALAFGQAIAGVAVIMVAGRFLVRPLLRSAAHTGSRDLIMAITLLIVVGISAATEAAGLSVALGAFLAGLLIGDSEFRHQIEVDIDPFKGLLLGIFFVTVGTSVNLGVVIDHLDVILLGLAGLIAVKAIILFGAARLFRVPTPQAVEVAILLSQAGEFAFIAIGIARGRNLLPPELATGALAVASLSMIVTPLLAVAARKLAAQLVPAEHTGHAPDLETARLADHVVIGGYGRVGEMVARILEQENVPVVALETDGAVVTRQRAAGHPVYFGDASRPELLEMAGARRARAFVITVNDAKAAERMVSAILAFRPKARIYARAKDADHARRLAELGALGAVPEATEASLQLAGRVLEALDLTEDTVLQRIAAAREEELDRLEQPAGRREK
jgi:CPA2 family monovalent cation:H+ antiporter-2